ncbi:MAG: DUF1566 domain-containing protein [Chloroflexi bacterium]|nr:DUF1566 domain-containing protein [Chloroflexota bacterium]
MGDCGFLPPPQPAGAVTYAIVDTGQGICYDNSDAIACPGAGQPFFGQDAQYAANPPRYRDNGDGTVTDLVTGLMWQQQIGGKATYDQAVAGAVALNLAGYNDWRLPTLKELYSLILFDGTDVSGCAGGTCSATPFIDTAYFGFEYGDAAAGERVIDAQYWSSTQYVSTTMNGDATVFGVNFADGRIKGYPREARGGANLQFVRYVRGSPDYGVNHFADNGDGAIADRATGLTWMQADSGQALNWEGSLAYCESLSLAGHDDWRLPNAKELQSLVDYTRAPAATGSAAIDPLFGSTTIADEGGGADYPFYWSSTTHADSNGSGSFAVYVAFGEALGFMETPPNSGNTQLLDVHGAGAQRSDPKSGDPAQWSEGHGPQGDVVRVYNYARCVRGGSVVFDPDGDPTAVRPAMTIENTGGQPSPAGSQPPPGGQGTGQGPDLAAAAAQLGVTEQQLRDALGPPPPDLAAAAARLGVTEAQLRAALGVP